MAFYDEMAVMALEMITEFGQPVTISKTEPGEYDPETGGEAPGATIEQIAQGILLDFTGLEFQNNSLIRQGDKKIKIAAKGVSAPELLSTVVAGVNTSNIHDYFTQPITMLTVINVKQVSPAGTPIIYEIQGRR